MQEPPDSSPPRSTNESVAAAGDNSAATSVNPSGVSASEGDTAAEPAQRTNTRPPSEIVSDARPCEPQSDPPTEPPQASAPEKNQAVPVERPPLVDLVRLYPGGDITARVFQLENGVARPFGVEYREQECPMAGVPHAVYKSLLLPSRLNEYHSERQLFDSVRTLFQHHVMLSEKKSMLLSYWSIATWFADFLPFIPCLTITGPAFAADLLLQVLRCVCRRPLLLAGLSPAILRALPIDSLMPTLLIREPQLSKRMAALLAANQPGYYVISGKDVRQFYCAKGIYLGEDGQQSTVRLQGIHIRVAGNGLTPARSLPVSDVTQDLQNQLMFFRLDRHDLVASSKFQVPGFLPEFCAVAQALGAPFVRRPELQVGIIELLKEQDQQARIDRASGLSAIVLRAVLFHCHQGDQQQILVREIASTVNRICGEEGESLKISNETVGHVLKNLGLYTRRLGNMGRGLMLDKGTQLRAHELGNANQVLPETAGSPVCGYCHKLQLSQTEEVV